MMPDFYKKRIPIIDTEAPETNLTQPPGVAFGCVERDYELYPEPMFAPPSEMTLIPESEWDARYDEQEEQASSLEHMYLPNGPNGEPAFVNLDQDGHGYCWSYSTGHAIMMDLLRRNMVVDRINPHATAAIIKRGRDEGGWCGLSADFGRRVGYAVEGTRAGQWPLHSRDLRYDTPELRTQMAKHRLEEEWTDLTREVYNQNLTRQQCATSGFNNLPGPRDYNWWRHSVCGIRWVRIERGNWGQLILNSWKGWGRHGLAVLQGSKAICDGGLSVRVTT